MRWYLRCLLQYTKQLRCWPQQYSREMQVAPAAATSASSTRSFAVPHKSIASSGIASHTYIGIELIAEHPYETIYQTAVQVQRSVTPGPSRSQDTASPAFRGRSSSSGGTQKELVWQMHIHMARMRSSMSMYGKKQICLVNITKHTSYMCAHVCRQAKGYEHEYVKIQRMNIDKVGDQRSCPRIVQSKVLKVLILWSQGSTICEAMIVLSLYNTTQIEYIQYIDNDIHVDDVSTVILRDAERLWWIPS